MTVGKTAGCRANKAMLPGCGNIRGMSMRLNATITPNSARDPLNRNQHARPYSTSTARSTTGFVARPNPIRGLRAAGDREQRDVRLVMDDVEHHMRQHADG